MKRQLIWLIVLMLVFAGLTGCSSSTGDKQMATTTAGYSPGAGEHKSESSLPEVTVARKIIRNASLDLEAADVAAAYDALLSWAAERGGYEIRREQRRSDGYITIDAQIKIKPEHLDDLLAYAATLGDVINTQISTEDITDSYYDAKTRLQTMELSLENYYAYLKKAVSIEESLSVQREINQLTAEIESLKGRLKLWDSLLAESVVTLRLRQTDDPVKLKKEIDWSTLSFSDMGYLMKNGLTAVANALVSVLQWLAIVLVAASPLWIIALVVILVLRRKKRRAALAKKQAEAAEKPAQEDPKP